MNEDSSSLQQKGLNDSESWCTNKIYISIISGTYETLTESTGKKKYRLNKNTFKSLRVRWSNKTICLNMSRLSLSVFSVLIAEITVFLHICPFLMLTSGSIGGLFSWSFVRLSIVCTLTWSLCGCLSLLFSFTLFMTFSNLSQLILDYFMYKKYWLPYSFSICIPPPPQ